MEELMLLLFIGLFAVSLFAFFSMILGVKEPMYDDFHNLEIEIQREMDRARNKAGFIVDTSVNISNVSKDEISALDNPLARG